MLVKFQSQILDCFGFVLLVKCSSGWPHDLITCSVNLQQAATTQQLTDVLDRP